MPGTQSRLVPREELLSLQIIPNQGAPHPYAVLIRKKECLSTFVLQSWFEFSLLSNLQAHWNSFSLITGSQIPPTTSGWLNISWF